MKRLIILLAATASLAACSPEQSGSLGPAPTVSPGASTSPASATPSASAEVTPDGVMTIQAWFTRGGRLFPALRTQPRTLATSRLALTELTEGPTPPETAAGVGNAVPTNLAFTIPGIAGGVATVDLPASFYTGGADVIRLRQAQVVYTLTQFSTVSRVDFRNGGAATGLPGSRADYADLLPAIVVTSLTIGQRISNPVTIAGTANVFEATVSIAILDARRAEIASTFTTATCGTGCRGDYSASVGYRLGSEQPGTVEVYEVSAKDGSRVNVVDIPVTLSSSP
jgi:hypothetical protein